MLQLQKTPSSIRKVWRYQGVIRSRKSQKTNNTMAKRKTGNVRLANTSTHIHTQPVKVKLQWYIFLGIYHCKIYQIYILYQLNRIKKYIKTWTQNVNFVDLVHVRLLNKKYQVRPKFYSANYFNDACKDITMKGDSAIKNDVSLNKAMEIKDKRTS